MSSSFPTRFWLALPLTILALACSSSEPTARAPAPAVDKPTPTPQPPTTVSLDGAADSCTEGTMVPVAVALDPKHPCHRWVSALFGRVVSVGKGYAGSVVSRTGDDRAVVVTCAHCSASLGKLAVPGAAGATSIGQPATVEGDRVVSSMFGAEREQWYRWGFYLFGLEAPKSSYDSKGGLSQIPPSYDFTLLVLSGKTIKVYGHLAAMPPQTFPSDPVVVADPAGTLPSKPDIAGASAGQRVLAIGAPRDQGSQLTFTVAEVLTDDRAAETIANAEEDERKHVYNPAIEFVIGARSTGGNSGGGVFDKDGRYLGVMVRGSVTAVEGKHFTRVVRASYIAAELTKAVEAASDDARAALKPFLPGW